MPQIPQKTLLGILLVVGGATGHDVRIGGAAFLVDEVAEAFGGLAGGLICKACAITHVRLSIFMILKLYE